MMFITFIIVLHTENIISNDSNGNNNNNSNNIPSAQVRTKVFNFSTEPNCIVAIPIYISNALGAPARRLQINIKYIITLSTMLIISYYVCTAVLQ